MPSGLFTYEGHRVVISPEALLLKPYKKLWDRDASQDKHKAESELGYMYFFCDPRSDFQIFTDEEVRHQKIVEGEGMSKTWKPDKLVKAAMDYYISFIPTASKLLQSLRKQIDLTIKANETLDPLGIDDPLERAKIIKEMAAASAKGLQLVEAFDKVEKTLFKEITEQSASKGSQELTILD